RRRVVRTSQRNEHELHTHAVLFCSERAAVAGAERREAGQNRYCDGQSGQRERVAKPPAPQVLQSECQHCLQRWRLVDSNASGCSEVASKTSRQRTASATAVNEILACALTG